MWGEYSQYLPRSIFFQSFCEKWNKHSFRLAPVAVCDWSSDSSSTLEDILAGFFCPVGRCRLLSVRERIDSIRYSFPQFRIWFETHAFLFSVNLFSFISKHFLCSLFFSFLNLEALLGFEDLYQYCGPFYSLPHDWRHWTFFKYYCWFVYISTKMY